MATFTINVIETLAVSRQYTVEAVDMHEAELKALVGDTTAEDTLATLGVVNRELDSEQ